MVIGTNYLIINYELHSQKWQTSMKSLELEIKVKIDRKQVFYR